MLLLNLSHSGKALPNQGIVQYPKALPAVFFIKMNAHETKLTGFSRNVPRELCFLVEVFYL